MAVATSEYELAKRSAVVVDRSNRGRLILTGSDVADFLQGQVSNDVEALTPGSGTYATLLTAKGKIRCDMRILRGDEWFLVDSEPQALPVLEHMVRVYSIGRDVETTRDERPLWSVIGPGAAAALDDPPPATEHAHTQGELGLYVATDLGIDVLGERPDLPEASAETAEILRIEAGRPRLGFELGDDVIPQEAGINERAISFTKGCYVGQETVARLYYKGKPNRHLRGLRLSQPVERGAVIHGAERELGRVSSACVSPRFGPIALALVRREAAPGDSVQVGDGDVVAQVVELPF
ncbi:MAG TPA: glycine cleavage T C-terminal barrel domain-containing protein [Thermoleophilaceae bacterium]|nr:glycine cleavage T C-terminal barrel domain-containing protein [Thermoleophilaceae bacterium]